MSCEDCGDEVASLGLRRGHCFFCNWLTTVEDADARAALRRSLYDKRRWDYWINYGVYRDERFPERVCTACGQRYRGHGVYCCLSCALGDAK